jgi:hypothetical protein
MLVAADAGDEVMPAGDEVIPVAADAGSEVKPEAAAAQMLATRSCRRRQLHRCW